MGMLVLFDVVGIDHMGPSNREIDDNIRIKWLGSLRSRRGLFIIYKEKSDL